MIDIDDTNTDWALIAKQHYYMKGDGVMGYHRVQGPLLSETGRPLWYWQGNQYSFEHWCILCGHSDEEAMLLRMKYL
jgi:hypothetical protein